MVLKISTAGPLGRAPGLRRAPRTSTWQRGAAPTRSSRSTSCSPSRGRNLERYFLRAAKSGPLTPKCLD
eukprot:7269099-Alexandrium_andersonii.AAC.1